MLKNLFRYKILCELNNGITVSIRRISERKMYGRNEDQYQKQHPDSFKDKRYYALERNNGDQSNPLKRDWVNVNGFPRNQGFVFTLLNYNILSQQLLEQHSYLYQEHQKNALRWNHRFYNIVGEIFRIQPDLCMFQEVQQTHLCDIQGRLRSLNYDVVYKKRTGDKPDGCAIFYKRDLFNLIESHKIEFEQPGIELLKRENVAIVCKLQLKSDPTCQFVVATTHLLYNPKRQDIRLAQIQVLLAELDRISKINENNDKSNFPIILSGDFNLQPYSAPHNLIVNGVLKYENLSRKSLSNEDSSSPNNGRKLLPIKLGITDECQHINHEKKLLYHSEQNRIQNNQDDVELTKEIVNLFQTGILRHNLDFNSVYKDSDKFVSTFQNQWILVDYMFYTNSKNSSTNNKNNSQLTLLEYLTLPSSEECEKIRLKIPNDFLGSDHLSLAARFHISTQSNYPTKL